MKQGKKIIVSLLYPTVAVAIAICVWAIAANAVGVELVLPTPAAAFRRFFEVAREGAFYRALFSTVWRSLVCFFLCTLFAGFFACLSALFSPVYRLVSPFIAVLRAVPTMSIIILCLIWLMPDTTPSVVAGIITFPALYSGFYAAITGVDVRLLEMARVYRIPKIKRVTHIILPQAAEPAFHQLQSAIGLNLKVLIAAEVMASTANSIGNLMKNSQVQLDTASLFAYTAAAIAVSLMLELAVFGLRYLCLRWKRVAS